MISSNWNEIRKLLNEVWNSLASERSARESSAAPIGLLSGTSEEFEELLDHNELELAWDALAQVAKRDSAPAACWRRLARAARLMRLLDKEEEALRHAQPRISPDQALNIARLDAEKAYRNLLTYRLTLTFEPDGWHVDYDLRDPGICGGGPHYVIDPTSGEILSKRYEQ
jgi:hypothetical protein